LDEAAVKAFPSDAPTGVYVGFAKVNNDKVFPMAMSVGFNVHYGVDHKTVEVHILHEFENDFYDALITAVALKYLRPMKQFKSKGKFFLNNFIPNTVFFRRTHRSNRRR
jgi:riboflavin kinase